jgi:hypothetical protein
VLDPHLQARLLDARTLTRSDRHESISMRTDPNNYVEFQLVSIEGAGLDSAADGDDEDESVDGDLIYELHDRVYERVVAWHRSVAPRDAAFIEEHGFDPEELVDPMTNYFENAELSFSYNNTDYGYDASTKFAAHVVDVGVRALAAELERDVLGPRGYRFQGLDPLGRDLVMGNDPFTLLRGWPYEIGTSPFVDAPAWAKEIYAWGTHLFFKSFDEKHKLEPADFSPEERTVVAAASLTGHCACEACVSVRGSILGVALATPTSLLLPSLLHARDALLGADDIRDAAVRGPAAWEEWSEEQWISVIAHGPDEVQVAQDWLAARAIELPWPMIAGLIRQISRLKRRDRP